VFIPDLLEKSEALAASLRSKLLKFFIYCLLVHYGLFINCGNLFVAYCIASTKSATHGCLIVAMQPATKN